MSTTAAITDALRARILRGELTPGEPLRQDALAAQFQVSKIPVREALSRLTAEGLLVAHAHRGVRVRELTPGQVTEVYGLRRALEPVLLDRALPRLTIVDLAEAELALTEGEPTDPEANWRFHRALYRASGWEHGLALLAPLFAVVAPYLVLYTDHLGAGDRSHDEHHALLAAARTSDAATARTVLDAHLSGAEDALVRHLEVVADAPADSPSTPATEAP